MTKATELFLSVDDALLSVAETLIENLANAEAVYDGLADDYRKIDGGLRGGKDGFTKCQWDEARSQLNAASFAIEKVKAVLSVIAKTQSELSVKAFQSKLFDVRAALQAQVKS